jgi:hypothetical protein
MWSSKYLRIVDKYSIRLHDIKSQETVIFKFIAVRIWNFPRLCRCHPNSTYKFAVSVTVRVTKIHLQKSLPRTFHLLASSAFTCVLKHSSKSPHYFPNNITNYVVVSIIRTQYERRITNIGELFWRELSFYIYICRQHRNVIQSFCWEPMGPWVHGSILVSCNKFPEADKR